MNRQEENYSTKNIREYKPGDSIYIKKNKSGYDIHVLSKFVKFEKGLVTVLPVEVEPDWSRRWFMEKMEFVEVTVRLSNCYVFGKSPNQEFDWPMCHWFQKNGFLEMDNA